MKEIELKYDVEEGIDFITSLESLGYHIVSEKKVRREFQFYDTTDFVFYHQGMTLRRVSGFNPAEKRFRYDLKTGTLEERFEESHWSDEEVEDIGGIFGIEKEIIPVATARTQHHKTRMRNGVTVIETSLDKFHLENGIYFREFEIEFQYGNEEEMQDIARGMETYRSLTEQKYKRVVDCLGLL